MQNQCLIAIVLSAFLHALYNLIMRRSRKGDLSFVTGMFGIASLIACVVALTEGSYLNTAWSSIPYIFGAAFFYILYQAFVFRAYQHGEVSSLYPLTVLSPIFIPIWAAVALDEKLSIMTALGIALTVLGAVLVQQPSLSLDELGQAFRRKDAHRGAGYALGASFFYSLGAVSDKWKIGDFPLTLYLALLISFMFFNALVYQLTWARTPLLSHLRSHAGTVCLAGTIVYLSFYTFRIALPEVPVSIAVPVRQIAIVFAIIMGITVLKERFSLCNAVGSLLIMAGIALIHLMG